jgi:hypothetical protein
LPAGKVTGTNREVEAVVAASFAARTAIALRQREAVLGGRGRRQDDHVLTAKSQRYDKMDKREFAKCKTAVLDYLARGLDTTPEQLSEAEKRAA